MMQLADSCKISVHSYIFHGQELIKALMTSLHDQNKRGFFGGPAFFHPITTIWKVFKKP